MSESTNFNKSHIEKINAILRFSIENEYCDFYRNKYKNKEIQEISSFEDFSKIPLLKKDEILAIDADKRFFVNKNKIKSYSFTSGTTTHNRPLIMPRMNLSYQEKNLDAQENELYNFTENSLSEYGVSKLLILLPPLSPLFNMHLKINMQGAVAIPGDLHNLSLMAKIAKELKIDAIVTTATILEFFKKELDKISCDASQFKWISIGGEFCSTQRFGELKNSFPLAQFDVRYGISEIGGRRFYRCKHLNNSKSPNEFHIIPKSAIIEIINEDGNISIGNEPGEVVITDLYPRPFPMIRYKTNDVGSLTTRQCPCGNDTLFTMGGRYHYEVIKYKGSVISATMIGQALEPLKEIAEQRFQMHLHEKNINGKIKPYLELHLQLKKEFFGKENDPIFIAFLKESISSNFYLSKSATLKQLEEDGIFLPLSIVFIQEWPKNEFKVKHIISHLS